ncbi:MAG: hypothetical protein K6B64_00705 [Acholeplasmatales bacterium]|nr:hypothetical protein [Acholeplasmatales bacterium]
MPKIKVMFPRVEAGFGHIMTCNAVEEIFSRKYGDKFEIININFFSEAEDEKVKKLGEKLKKAVRTYTSKPLVGHFATFNCEFWGTDLSTWGSMRFLVPGSAKKGVEFLQTFKPDVVFSTHWATNYYAEQMEKKPFTVMYCPDALLNKLFKYRADLSLVSMETGYIEAKKDTSYNSQNLKLVPFCIRNDAFDLKDDKMTSRKKLGLPMDKFTVVLAEGGYGRGAMKDICTRLVKEHIPVTVIPVCGKNKELLEYFKGLKPTEEVTFLPQGFITNIFEYLNSADLFCGKAGNMIAEPTFFGVPSIITGTSTSIETNIGDYYINYVHCAVKQFNHKKVVKMIKNLVKDPSVLVPYQKAAKDHHSSYGAEATADILFEAIVKRFPQVLQEENEENEK